VKGRTLRCAIARPLFLVIPRPLQPSRHYAAPEGAQIFNTTPTQHCDQNTASALGYDLSSRLRDWRNLASAVFALTINPANLKLETSV